MKKIDIDEFAVQVRSRFLAANAFAGADLGMWSLGHNRELNYSTCINEKEIWSFLELSDCLDFLYEKRREWDRPVILSDQIGLVWIAEDMVSDGSWRCRVLMGPMFLSKTSVKYIEDSLRERISSVFLRRQLTRMLTTVPVITLPMMNQYAKMLHYTLTLEKILPVDFLFQDERTKQFIEGEEDVADIAMASDPERIMKSEMLLLKAVTDGNLNYGEIYNERKDFESELTPVSGNALRDAKNEVLVFCSLCCRAAIQGGVSIKTAKEMEVKYHTKIERVDTITKLKNLNTEMLDDYVSRVHDGRENPLISKTIQECCDYIRANVTKPLDVDGIAAKMGYATYYFTRKFYKEMGIKVSDYIKQARIEYAKVEVMTSRKSIQEISDTLQFGTRNYFSRVFQEVVGMTPAAYRDGIGKEGEQI